MTVPKRKLWYEGPQGNGPESNKPADPAALQTMYKEWVEHIQDHGVNLSVWEQDFIGSIEGQLAAGRSLSDKQAQILERIYAEKTP